MQNAVDPPKHPFLSLLGLASLAVAEPVLSIYSKSPGIFVFYGADNPGTVLAFAAIVALVPALIATLLYQLAKLAHRRLGNGVFYACILALVFAWSVQLLRWSANIDSTPVLAIGAALGAAGFLVAFLRSGFLRELTRVIALAAAVLAGLFMFQLNAAGLFDTATDSRDATGPAARDMPSVLFVILDEFPTVLLLDKTGKIDRSLYPNIASLADEGTWYSHYTVMASQTYNSVPAILSGTTPKNASPTVKHYPTNLFSLLEGSHDPIALESITKLCVSEACNANLDRPGRKEALLQLLASSAEIWGQRVTLGERPTISMDTYIENTTAKKQAKDKPVLDAKKMFDPKFQIELAKNRPQRLQNLVDNIKPGDRPALYFLHLQLPHSPWRFYPDGELYSVPRARQIIASHNEVDWLTRVAEYRLLMQAQYTDRLMGELFQRFKDEGLWDDTLVVITSDHGRSLFPNTATRSLVDAFPHVAYVPLIIKVPNQAGGSIDTSNTLAVDLLPSIADWVGVGLDTNTDGFTFGSEAIKARGDEKPVYPLDTKKRAFPLKIGSQQVFSDRDNFPTFASRRLQGPLQAGTAFETLNAPLNLSRYLGQPLSNFSPSQGGNVTVDDLDAAQQQPEGRPPLGLLFGSLEADDQGGRILVAVNGVFVSGSPLFAFGKDKRVFLAMLPQGTLRGENMIELFRLDGETLYALHMIQG